MALNITLAGTVYDKDDNQINANLQIFVLNENNNLTKWSDIFYTEDFDYNKNLGDPDISGQENTLGLSDSNGEFVVIAVWKDGDRTVDNIPTQFAYIIQELRGEEVYVQDIQLGIPLSITCNNWDLDSQIIQGENIIAINHNTNELQYIAKNKEHFLFNKFRNEIMFPFIGTKEVYFNFNNEGYSGSNVYSPGVGGDCLVQIKILDYFGTEVTCEKISNVFYNVSCGFTDNPGNYVLNDTLNIVNDTSGHIDRIKSIKYEINGIIYNSADVSIILDSVGTINVNQIVIYNDAYNDITINCNRNIIMENIPPELNLEAVEVPKNNIVKKDYEFAHNGTDEDGYIESVEWQLWRNNPDINGNDNWNLYYTTGLITDLGNWTYNIDDIIGELMVVAIVYDNMGASAKQEFLIDNDCSDVSIKFSDIDWGKNVIKTEFHLIVNSKIWKIKENKIKWSNTIIPIIWDMTPKKLDFSQKINKDTWVYKIYTKL